MNRDRPSLVAPSVLRPGSWSGGAEHFSFRLLGPTMGDRDGLVRFDGLVWTPGSDRSMKHAGTRTRLDSGLEGWVFGPCRGFNLVTCEVKSVLVFMTCIFTIDPARKLPGHHSV